MSCRLRGCPSPPLNSLVSLLLLNVLASIPTNVHGANVYKIGYISQFLGGGSKTGLKISGALSYAAQKINESTYLLGEDKLDIICADEKGDSLLATRHVVEMYNKNVSLIIGPENFCKHEAHLATAVGLPIFSYKCNDPTMRIKETNLISLVPSEKYVVEMLIKLFEHFNWRKFTLVYEDGSMRPIRTQLRNYVDQHQDKRFVMKEQVYASPGSPGCDPLTKKCGNHVMAEIIKSTRDTTRIYVVMGNVGNLSRFGFTLATMGMTKKGEYKVIYISTEFFIDDFNELFHYGASPYSPWYKYGQNVGMKHVLAIVPRAPKGQILSEEFENIVREHSQRHPFNLASPPNLGKKRISIFAYYLYDSLMTWARAVTEIRLLNGNWTDGAVVAEHIRKTTVIPSLTGINLTLEKDGHVVGEYELLAPEIPSDPMSKVGLFTVVGRFSVRNGEVNLTLDTELFEGRIVLDEPVCGFDGLKCPSELETIRKWTASILCVILVVSAIVVTVMYRYWEYEQEIAGLLWMIDKSELTTYEGGALSAVSKMSLVSQGSANSVGFIPATDLHVCKYQGAYIVVKKMLLFRRGAGDIPRELKKEMKIMKKLMHHNVNPFIGVFVSEPNHIYACTEFCTKGSLQEVLEDEEVYKLDNMFIASLVTDLVRGIEYIHQSALRVHGNLKSTNCLVTNKWTLQLSDFGLGECRYYTEDRSDAMQYYKRQLWRSPQLLRSRHAKIYEPATQKDDIYSFAIIMHEIMSRKGVWGSINLTPEEICDRVRAEPIKEKDAFRPLLEDIQCQDYIVKVITDSWAENPESRPDISNAAARLKKIRRGMNDNIVDNMVTMLATYANNLEDIVGDRTRKLEEEKRKTETLLHRMLPKSVAVQLMGGEFVKPESFDAVTIYFSDIVGFTDMSSTSTPMEVVNFLNDLYTLFDSIIRNYTVYKVETIGDAYMVVSGLPERNGTEHASEIALMALELLDAIRTFEIRHRRDQKLKLRIGLHTGPVVAGVVGLTMPRYCLFGDTVNTASRMESTGEALKVHVSSQTKQVLDLMGGFFLDRRGYVEMKGKGAQLTYWLTGHINGIPRRRQEHVVPVTPLFNGPLQEETRRASLVPALDSNIIDSLPNGGVKARMIHNASMISKRPSQAKLQQSKHSATPPFFINIGEDAKEGTQEMTSDEEKPGISFTIKEPTVSFDTNGPTKIRRNGSRFGQGNDDSTAPLLPRPIHRARFDDNLGKRCHSLDNELSRISSQTRTVDRSKNAVQDRPNLNNNCAQRDRESCV